LFAWSSQAQQSENETKLEQQMEFTFNEYLGCVEVSSAGKQLSSASPYLMLSKKFKDTEYYSILNSSFKIPTWYDIEIKAGFEQNRRLYLNPENTVPNAGLASRHFCTSRSRIVHQSTMADLRKAKMQMQLEQAERKLLIIAVLYDASVAYFNWKKNFEEFQMYSQYNTNAETRFKAIKSLIKQGTICIL
jgi:hypothetical protein